MCTTTDESTEPVEGVEPEDAPRDLNTLLSLGTYQRMTDTEIEMVLSYRVEVAVADRELLARIAAATEREEQCIADNRASAAATLAMLQSIIESEFPTVPLLTPQTFTPRSTEV